MEAISVFSFAMLAILCAVVGCVSVILCTFDPWSDLESWVIVIWSSIGMINLLITSLIILGGQCSIYFAIVIAYLTVMAILNVEMRHMWSHNRFIVAIVVNLIAMLLFIGVIHTHFEDKANINLHEDNAKQIETEITT